MKKIIDITPQKFLCAVQSSCPAVFKTENNTYHLIGDAIDPNTPHVKDRVAEGELVIEIPRELLEQAVVTEVFRRLGYT